MRDSFQTVHMFESAPVTGFFEGEGMRFGLIHAGKKGLAQTLAFVTSFIQLVRKRVLGSG
jgi:hypothetical protein